MASEQSQILIFKAITGFISDIHSEFGKKYKSVALYNRLLEKTGIMNNGPILKHIECFRQFFDKNRQAMEKQDIAFLVETKISYSSNVYVDVYQLISHTTEENAKIIWKHLLAIWNLIDPLSGATRIMKEHFASSSSSSDNKEQDFLSNIMSKVQESAEKANINEKSNPMEALTSLMQSGAMNDLVSGMYKGLSDGSLDIGKLMGSVQGMMGGMQGMGGAGMQGNPQGMPDLSGIMNMMGPMMSSFMGGMQGMGGNNGPKIEEEEK